MTLYIKNIKILVAILIILLLITGCGGPDSKELKKKAVIKGYLNELFKLDKDLVKKYELETPLRTDEDPPKQYVDRQYFRELPRINKFIREGALEETKTVNPPFVIPYGMVLKKVDGTVIGKVVDIKKVKEILIDWDVYPSEQMIYPTEVTAIVKLDNGKDAEVIFYFGVSLRKQFSEYVINTAPFDTTPWLIKTGLFRYDGPDGTKVKN